MRSPHDVVEHIGPFEIRFRTIVTPLRDQDGEIRIAHVAPGQIRCYWRRIRVPQKLVALWA